MKNGADPRCRTGTQYEKTIDPLMPGSPTLAPNEYLNRDIEYSNTSIGKSVNIMEPTMLKTGMNISQKLPQKLTLPSYEITTYKQTEKSNQTSHT